MKREKHSHIDADEEQKRYLDIEKKYSKQNRALNIALTAAFFAFIYVFAILFWVIPDKTSSAEENRALATAPKFSIEALVEKGAEGSFTDRFAVYMADQFPARNFFVGLKAESERLLFKGQNNGVIFAKDGYLVSRFDNPDTENLKVNLNYIADFAGGAKELGIDVTVALAGRKIDVASSVMPPSFGTSEQDEVWETIDNTLSSRGVSYIDLRSELKDHFDDGEYVYYKTDHHWTTLGAYYAYEKTAREMGIDPAPISSFRRETVSDSFYGTTWSASGAKWIKPDTVEFFRYDGDENFLTDRGYGQDGQRDVINGLYQTSFLNEKDKYSSFIGGNAGRIDITADGEGREKILVVRDSFFNSTAPFFAKDLDMVVLDLRPLYYKMKSSDDYLTEICRAEGIDRVLILVNAETLCNETMKYISLGLPAKSN